MMIRKAEAEELESQKSRLASTGSATGAMPLGRLPPLNALRCFEVAARHESFTKAARELFVTPAAVGQQVRQLEAILGQALFRRENRRLVPTAIGLALLPGIREGFAQLAHAVGLAQDRSDDRRLTVSVAPSFAAKWLLPRLSDFEQRHPEFDLRVEASMQLADLDDGSTDLAIRYGAGGYTGLLVERLLGEEVVPVCSPALLAKGPPLSEPQDLKRHTLLHDDSPDNDPTCPSWGMWLRAAGVDGVDAERGPRFSQSSLVLEAAALGRGVALAKATIAADDLASGRVLRLFEMAAPLAFAYYLVYSQSAATKPRVAAFRRWLLGQAGAASPPSAAGFPGRDISKGSTD